MQIYEGVTAACGGYEREDGRGVHIRVRPSITWVGEERLTIL